MNIYIYKVVAKSHEKNPKKYDQSLKQNEYVFEKFDAHHLLFLSIMISPHLVTLFYIFTAHLHNYH